MARPIVHNLDEAKLVKLARQGNSIDDIALIMGCSTDTLRRRYRSAIDTGKAQMRKRLRAKQLDVAMKGNPQMLIWLGKQELGQKDRLDHTTDDKPFTVMSVHGVSMDEL